MSTVGKQSRLQKQTTRKEDQQFYKLHLVWYRIRHGLILHSIRNLLLRLKININPFWLEREGLDFCDKPTLRDDPSLYRMESLDVALVYDLFRSLHWSTSTLSEQPGTEYLAVGLYREDDLAALMMIRFGQFKSGNKTFKLEQHEAYLENMYTYENFRGRNIAPYLRYKCYELLDGMGRTVCYSITQYFNTSSLKFKAKLNARHQKLYIFIGLFKKLERTYLLKTYIY